MSCRLIAFIAATLPLAHAADIHIVEEIVAKVNGDIITRGEIDRTRQGLEQEFRQRGLTGQALADAVRDEQKNALRDQIDQLLLVQRGKDMNLNVDSDVTRRIAQIQSQSKISDPDKFHDYIREQTGMSFEDFRDQMKKQLLTQRVIGDEISSRISIPEADLKKYYDEHPAEFVREEQVFLSQILISTEGKTPEQVAAAQKKAADLVARARKGEKFSDLARDNSDDPATARDGGQLPPYKRSDHLLVKDIEDMVFSMKKGQVTDPIKTPAGLLILKVDERFEAGQASFEEVKNEITEKLAGPKMEPKVREYLTRLREDAFLQIKDGYVDSGAAPGKDTRWQDVATLKPETTTKEEVAAKRKRKLLKIIPLGSAKSSVDTPAPAAPAAAPPAAGTAPAAKP
ncbi:MAG TPA: peptidylprolyl isomerase [Bryobacteraceae bacterium]|nr:peptidylprolyl isomerase [Bryobacteraceae bacterium]